MKLKTSSSDLTIVRKNITRFAPAWALYSVFLLLMYIMVISSRGNYAAEGFYDTTWALSIINFCYALICGQLLFGDLFNARMANALHAMPIRREAWFAGHMVSGLLFSLVPNGILALVMIPACGDVPLLPWLWLLTNVCQYLFFFSLAAVCALCVGSRFAMAVVYGLVNFGSLLVYWLLDTLYIPQLYGVILSGEPFLQWSPVVYGTMNIPYDRNMTGLYPNEEMHLTLIPEILAYTGILAAVGAVLVVIALVLYRKRHLEAAGDFIAVNRLKPVFLILYTLMMGAAFQFLLGMFGTGSNYIYLVIGVLVGYFTGQMLLMRTTRVFGKKSLLGFAVFSAVLVLSLIITAVDPLGIASFVPKPEHVASVSINHEESEDPEVIAELTRIHGIILKEPGVTSGFATSVNLTYTMKDGTTVQRHYVITNNGDAHKLLEPIMSRPEFVLEILYSDPSLLANATIADYYGEDVKMTDSQKNELYRAILADCEAGTMAQGSYNSGNQSKQAYHLYFQLFDPDTRSYYHISIWVYDEAENTVSWLKEQGLYQKWQEDIADGKW